MREECARCGIMNGNLEHNIETTKMDENINLNYYKAKAGQFDLMKKAFLKFVRAIPRTVLEEWLIEGKILKRDYLTNKISLKSNRNINSKNI